MNRTNVSLTRAVLPLIALPLSLALPARSATAQSAGEASVRYEVFSGGQEESYLRYLQTTGAVRQYPWSSRAFSFREIDKLVPRDTAHPWRARFADRSRRYAGVRFGLIQPRLTLRYNSGFAYGSNDGAVWAGRGLTSAMQLGFFARWGPASLTVAPLVFRAENQSFAIRPTGQASRTLFEDPDFGGIDRPQRFGDSPYSQLDPGQSTFRVDFPYVAVGASTANQGWGPGESLPVLLGNNAAGFPHLFAGTSEPLDIFVARIHAKVIWGVLFQSDYSPVTGPERFTSRSEPGTTRFATGLVTVAQPRGIPGLEVGAARFFHSIWPNSGIPRSYLTNVFQGFLKSGLEPDGIGDPQSPVEGDNVGISYNQLSSVFGRWALARSGFELHGEYGRDDHSADFRDLTQEPDHARVYSFGARKVFRSRTNALTAGRMEIMNFQLPQLVRYRSEGEIYAHGLIRQGHTYRGQLLGADAGVGTGAGSTLAVDHFTPNGRWTASWSRVVRRERGKFLELGVLTPRSIDVSHAVGFEASRFMKGFDVSGGVAAVLNLNRDFVRDATNLNATAGVRYRLR